MKKLILALLLVAGTLSAQEKERSVWINDVLKPYVETWSEVMVADGWDIVGIAQRGDVFIIFDRDIDKDLGEKAGVALGMNNDETVFVMINIEYWVALTEFEKQDLINHELMHDFYNVEHTDEENASKLMHPTSYAKSTGDMIVRLLDSIKDLNNANGY